MGSKRTFTPGEVIVIFRVGVTKTEANTIIKSLNLVSKDDDLFESMATLLVGCEHGREKELCKQLKLNNKIASAEPNYTHTLPHPGAHLRIKHRK